MEACAGTFPVTPELRERVRFQRINLNEGLPPTRQLRHDFPAQGEG